MDGGFQVVSDAETVSELVSRIAPALLADPARRGDMWDLDEIYWHGYPKPWDLDRALATFVAAVDCYSPWSSQLVATLSIQLRQSDALVIEGPSLLSTASLDVNPSHPPAVGFVKKIRPAASAYEQYRLPVRQGLVQIADGDVRAYYECWRSPEALAADEPYNRVAVLQHWS